MSTRRVPPVCTPIRVDTQLPTSLLAGSRDAVTPTTGPISPCSTSATGNVSVPTDRTRPARRRHRYTSPPPDLGPSTAEAWPLGRCSSSPAGVTLYTVLSYADAVAHWAQAEARGDTA